VPPLRWPIAAQFAATSTVAEDTDVFDITTETPIPLAVAAKLVGRQSSTDG
jgi:hypothetical protein